MGDSAARYAKIALAGLILVIIALLYFIAHLPLWACVLIAVAAMVVNSFALRVEDGEFTKQRRPKE